VGDFDRDTRIESLGGGRYRATPHPDWEIWGPNGGYVAAIALRAAGAETAIHRPSSFTCHYVAVARFEPVEIDVAVLRAGRRSELVRATMWQDGRMIVETLLRTAREGPGLEHEASSPPDVPHFDELVSTDDLFPDEAPRHAFWRNLEARPVDPSTVGGEPRVRAPEWLEWYRFRPRAVFDDVWLDAGRALLLLDTIAWPAAVGPHAGAGMIAPSLDVTVWFHELEPSSEWLLCHQTSPRARAGLMGAMGWIYSATGRLLASGGSHLLCAPAPPEG
jgi:acyl-CoA thioesterase-2